MTAFLDHLASHLIFPWSSSAFSLNAAVVFKDLEFKFDWPNGFTSENFRSGTLVLGDFGDARLMPFPG